MILKERREQNRADLMSTGISFKDANTIRRIVATLRKCTTQAEDLNRPYWADFRRGDRNVESYREVTALRRLSALQDKYRLQYHVSSNGAHIVNGIEVTK